MKIKTYKQKALLHPLFNLKRAIRQVYPFVSSKKRYFKLWCQLYIIYMQAFLGFSRSFLKLLRCKIVKSWLKEIKRHFSFQQSLFLIVVRVDLCLGFQDRKISSIFPKNAYKFACNSIHLASKKKMSYMLIQYLFEEEEYGMVW